MNTTRHFIQDVVASGNDKTSEYFQHPRRELLPFLPYAPARLLDIGCGAGAFLRNFDHGSVLRVGVEPNTAASAAARSHADYVVSGMFDASTVDHLKGLGFSSFDCISFNDVLEHMADPSKALKLAAGLLAENGFIIASVPNFLFYSNIWKILRTQDVRYEPAGIMDATHLRFFSKTSIVRLFQESGYVVKRVEGITSAISLKFRIVNFLSRNRIADLRFMQFAVVAERAPMQRASPS